MAFGIRFATEDDVPLILEFVRKLARYEKLESSVVATESLLRDEIFRRRGAEVIIGEADGKPVGFALFFHNFSTFVGKRGMYLEDLYVDEAERGKGYGKSLLVFIAQLAVERGCGRLEWAVLDWNAPSIAFYRSLGAKPMDEWTVFRLAGAEMVALAEEGR